MFDAHIMPDRISVALDNNKFATLTGLYRTSRSSNFVTAHEVYEANLSFVGPKEFVYAPSVKIMSFRPTNEMLAVMYRGHRVSRHLATDNITLAELEQEPHKGMRYLVDLIDHERCQAFAAKADRLQISGHILVSTNATVQGQTAQEEAR
ncbi:hypothetical protein ACFSGX_14620 [Sphingomonas arantia]|uniref:Uncharacterized protein n=1 Tax=Sphingomonas arantia TaxID=1460676 RepID=A0ABW4TZ42_9SPHN